MRRRMAGVRGDVLPPVGSRCKAPDSSRFRLSPLMNMSLAMLLVGATAPLGDLALSGVPLFVVLAVRLALAGLVLSWPLPGTGGPALRLSPRHWGVLAGQALCGVVVFNVGMWLGMRESGPAAAGIFTSATPAVMAGIGMVAFGERPTLRVLAGIGLTVAGVLAARSPAEGSWVPGAGDAYLAAAVAGESVFLLALKWLPGGLKPLEAARRITWLGLGMTVPLAALQGADAAWLGAPLSCWLAVGALGVLVTAGGYVLWFRGVSRATAGQAAAVTGLLPVSAVLASWALLGQPPTLGQVGGCLAVGAGIWLASGKALPQGK